MGIGVKLWFEKTPRISRVILRVLNLDKKGWHNRDKTAFSLFNELSKGTTAVLKI